MPLGPMRSVFCASVAAFTSSFFSSGAATAAGDGM
jgi:hypothetical protein